MKVASSVFLLILSLTSIVQGVLISDAFTSKETVNYLFGQLIQFTLVNNTLVGINSFDQLVGIDIKGEQAIRWRLNIADLTSSKLVSSQDKVYIYNQGKDIFQVDSVSGILDTVTLVGSPVEIVDGGQGVFVVDSIGKLSYIHNSLVNQFEIEGVETIRVDNNARFSFVLINDSRLLKISQGKVLFDVEVSVGSVKQFKSGIIISENDQVFKFVEKKKKFTRIENDSFKILQIINENYIYSTLEDSIKIINIKKKAELIYTLSIKSNSHIELLSSPLNDFLIVSNPIGIKDVFDLTDFLITNNPTSIKKITIKLTNHTTHDFLTIEQNKLGLLSLDINLQGELFSLFDGQLIKSIESHPQYYSKSNQYIIINPPESQTIIHQVHEILEIDNRFILTNWITRIKRHLSELGQFIVSLKNGITQSHDFEFGFIKYVVFFDDLHKKLIAINSYNGRIAWESGIINDEFVTISQLGEEKLIGIFHGFVLIFDSSDGSIIERIVNENFTEIVQVNNTCVVKGERTILLDTVIEDIYLLNKGDAFISGQVIPSRKILANDTWKFEFGEKIVAMAKIEHSVTSSVGIPLSDKSVLYKYLNPNLVSVITFDKQLKIYLIDGITGNLLYVSAHEEEIDLNSVKLVMDDNWIVYSYFTKSPRFEQRINVIDLFDSQYQTSNSAFTRNLTIDSIKSKSFIYPERILDLSSTKTNYGITIKSIIAITESGKLIEIPKYVLNSRRIDDRPLTKQDYINDFNVLPYDPILPQPPPINHKYQLHPQGKILIKSTRFESTLVVCYFNKFNQFCSLIQPSKSFDILKEGFDKGKLIITIVLLLVVFIVTKPFVFNKKLNNQWLDR